MWEKVVGSGRTPEPRRSALYALIAHMFLGQYQHTLDEKGRLMIPARFRELLDGGAFITQGFDRCLMVMTGESFRQVYDQLGSTSLTDPAARLLRRMILANAFQVY